MAPSMEISYVAVVLLRLMRGKCPKVNQGAMLKMVLGDLFEDLLGGKEGRRDAKIESMNRRKGSLASEKGYFKRTGHCQALRGVSVLIGGMRNSNTCVNW